MIKSYLKIAFRKNKVFSLINVFGLSIGLTCFMPIAVLVYSELNYDKYPANAKNIYRLILSVSVAIAFLISVPVMWLAMNKLPEDFACKININAWNFIAGGGLAVLIVLLTISFQAIKAAIAKPVKSLRTE